MADISIPKELRDLVRSSISTEAWSTMYNKAIHTVERYGMDKLMSNGVVLGLSGGSDSVSLLLFLLEYKYRNGTDFPIYAVHINHMIRGCEADRDEAFSKELCSVLGVDFRSYRVDIPSIASRLGKGLEECARDERYSILEEIRRGLGYGCIAVAHNSSDNAETVLMNIIRGTGLKGASGIKPVRDKIIRPLLAVDKKDIISYLTMLNCPYVNDSTNNEDDYTRNYLRHNVLPHLEHINPSFLSSVNRMSLLLRQDDEYISRAVDEAYVRLNCKAIKDGISRESLISLDKALSSRLISRLIYEQVSRYPDESLVQSVLSILYEGRGRVSVFGELDVAVYKERLYLIDTLKHSRAWSKILRYGINEIEELDCSIVIGDPPDNSFLNVYKFSIHAYVSSAIIDNGLIARSKTDGDCYRYGNMSHKLKKVFNDRDVPPFCRNMIPVICDEQGIVWVPGLPVRDGSTLDGTPVRFCLYYNSRLNALNNI